MITRGGIYWAQLGQPHGSRPGKRRPVMAIQSDAYNASLLGTVVACVVTSNTSLAPLPGNVFLPASATGLPKDSVANVTAIVTLDKTDLDEPVGIVPAYLLADVAQGLRRSLHL